MEDMVIAGSSGGVRTPLKICTPEFSPWTGLGYGGGAYEGEGGGGDDGGVAKGVMERLRRE